MIWAQATGAAAAKPTARTSFMPGRRGKPATRNASNAYPRSGTSVASTRSGDPANVTSTPRARRASATASDGATCPTVPPAAISARSCRSSATTRDVKEHAHREEGDNERRASVRHEGQRNSGQWRQAEHGSEVDRRLPCDQGRDPGCEPLAEGILALQGEPQSGVRERAIARDEHGGADEPELLADDGEDHVGVRLRQVMDLLDPLAEPPSEDAAGTEADLRLHVLQAGAEWILPRIEEREEARPAV